MKLFNYSNYTPLKWCNNNNCNTHSSHSSHRTKRRLLIHLSLSCSRAHPWKINERSINIRLCCTCVVTKAIKEQETSKKKKLLTEARYLVKLIEAEANTTRQLVYITAKQHPFQVYKGGWTTVTRDCILTKSQFSVYIIKNTVIVTVTTEMNGYIYSRLLLACTPKFLYSYS